MTETPVKSDVKKPRGGGRKTAKALREKSGGLSTRDFILEEATRLFAKEGYDRVTVRDISAATSMSMPTLYHHFGDKENLYREVEAKCYGALKDRLLTALESQGESEDRLRAFVSEMYVILLKDTNFLSIAIRNMLDPSVVNHKFLVDLSMREVYRRFADLLNEIRPGSGNGLAPMIIMSGILGFVLMNPAKRQLTDYPYRRNTDLNREREAFVDYAVGAVLRV
ncbi:MAG: helix-turn-helix domain containing protein [Halieaceae bacterium]|nr:helix-turn-helix domain containing protein [Halieaceae bacterium]